MKYTAVFCVIVITVATAEGQLVHGLRDRVRSTIFPSGIGALCVSESGASDEDVAALMSRQLPTTSEGKCLASCIFQHLGVSEANLRSRLEDAAFSFLNFLKEQNSPLYNTSMHILLECGSKMYTSPSKDLCEQAFEMMSCGLQQGLDNGIENIFSGLLTTNHRILFPDPSYSMTRNHATFLSELRRFDVLKLMD